MHQRVCWTWGPCIFTSLNALIKAATSAGHTKGCARRRAHAKTHIHTRGRAHLWQHNNWAYISWIWVTGIHSMGVLWCVIRLPGFLNCSAIQEENAGWPSHAGRIIWHRHYADACYRFAQDSEFTKGKGWWDTIFMLHLNLSKCLCCFIVLGSIFSEKCSQFLFSFILSISSTLSAVISTIWTCAIKVLITHTQTRTKPYHISLLSAPLFPL